MDIRKIKKLIELLEESAVSEIEIKEGEESVRIARHGTADAPGGAGRPAAVQYSAAQGAAAATPAPAASPAPKGARPAATESPSEPVAAEGEHMVTAPMVGTYYSAPSPGAKPYVAIGDEVEVGQVLCTIEAMKMMNQIESDVAGRIRAALVKNGEPVEFGQPLFIIE
jgi:acetyl-CoA carboxylase biotin carboxyl carrier protein